MSRRVACTKLHRSTPESSQDELGVLMLSDFWNFLSAIHGHRDTLVLETHCASENLRDKIQQIRHPRH